MSDCKHERGHATQVDGCKNCDRILMNETWIQVDRADLAEKRLAFAKRTLEQIAQSYRGADCAGWSLQTLKAIEAMK